MTDPVLHAVGPSMTDVAPEPGVVKPDPILVVDRMQRRFGGLMAVNVHHLEVQRGAITGLIGPNGAGKTTFFNLLTGFDKPDEGRWQVDGKELSRGYAYRMASYGMVRTFQITKALAKMSVLDNMMLGAGAQQGENIFRACVPFIWRSQEDDVRARAEALLEKFGLAAKRDEYAGTLSGGQRKLLEMARALMTEPRVILLDEPVAGVNPALTQQILEHVKTLRDEGMTVVFVEHDMDVVREVSNWVVVMAEGSIIAEGPHENVVANDHVIDAYLGRRHDEVGAAAPAAAAEGDDG